MESHATYLGVGGHQPFDQTDMPCTHERYGPELVFLCVGLFVALLPNLSRSEYGRRGRRRGPTQFGSTLNVHLEREARWPAVPVHVKI